MQEKKPFLRHTFFLKILVQKRNSDFCQISVGCFHDYDKRLCTSAEGFTFWLTSSLGTRCISRQLSEHSVLGSDGSAATSPLCTSLWGPAASIYRRPPPSKRLVDFSSFLTINARVWCVWVSGERFKAPRESQSCCIINTN